MITPIKNWKTVKRGYAFKSRTYYGSFHRGLDLIVPTDTPVYAVSHCKVVVSKRFIQGGNTVWIEFKDKKLGELVMRYMHLSTLPRLGVYEEGRMLALSGNTGLLTTGSHLHVDISHKPFDLNNIDNFIDPEEYFKNIEIEEVDTGFDNFAKNWEGRFILDVDELGKLYYVYKGKRHHIGQDMTLQGFAERFATGFKHKDVEKIPLG